MLTTRQREKRERIEERLKKIKYRLYQSGIAFACHDHLWLSELNRKIRKDTKKMSEMLGKRKTKRVTRTKKLAARK